MMLEQHPPHTGCYTEVARRQPAPASEESPRSQEDRRPFPQVNTLRLGEMLSLGKLVKGYTQTLNIMFEPS